MRASFLLSIAVASALAGCAVYPSVGEQQSDTPPQINIRDDTRLWDNPGAFGPVPSELQASGEAACALLDNDKVKFQPKGYHAKAMNSKGEAFPGGGYYCVPKS